MAWAIGFLLLVAAAESVHAQTFRVLYSFTGMEGNNPPGPLVRDEAGNFYGTGGGGAGTVLKLSLGKNGAWTETVLYRFQGAPNAAGPVGRLVLDSEGNFYGTTLNGGPANAGTVYKLTKGGKLTVLYSFCSVANCADGVQPNGGLVRDAAGNLYGTTALGGNAGECCGTVFKLDTSGNETVLYKFCSIANCADGSFPIGGGGFFFDETLVLDAAGNLYGTTPTGGDSPGCGETGCGVAYKVDAAGNETVLYNFCMEAKCADGSYPAVGLAQDTAGNLYGTTLVGGEHNYGGVFKVDATGAETVLYSFPRPLPLSEAYASSLIKDAAGNLYGTTESLGTFHEGMVFEVTKAWRTRKLYSFKDGTDGAFPYSLVQDPAGNLYGTTNVGGNLSDCKGLGCGTFFELTP
ncbi:MAG: choice-of-anchor tandem repeat GloVer-containing protein [Terriglobales bacterium]